MGSLRSRADRKRTRVAAYRERGDGVGLGKVDPEVARAVAAEVERQQTSLELIASENFTSPAVLEAMGSAAEQGVASAQSNLGMLYDKGQGVAQDFTEAARWYRRAAEQGFPEAQRNLGSMYEHGSGLPADALLAYAWYGVASAAGGEIALKLRARAARGMSSDEIAGARELAREMHQRYAAPVQEAP